MKHISLTPFGRQPVTASLLEMQALAEAPAPASADKWAILRDLTAARTVFSLSDRDLAVLAALLSFHPGKELRDDDGLIVFPSNLALSYRAHGMAESTLRRHLAALVQAGLILRRDSPNGKRYATRNLSGSYDRVFGFDLRPLLARGKDIAKAAEIVREAEVRLRRLREAVVIHLRDASKLIVWGWESAAAGPWDRLTEACATLQRRLRRKLTIEVITELRAESLALLARIKSLIVDDTEKMDGNDSENERHYQNSNTDSYESELRLEEAKEGSGVSPIPLGLVLKAAPDLRDYAPDGIVNWRDFIAVNDIVRPMLGISPDGWRAAQDVMGSENAAVTLACILQRSAEIARPGGYLRALTKKAAAGKFSPAPMVMALIRADNQRLA